MSVDILLDPNKAKKEKMMNENGMTGMQKMWASLSPEDRKSRTDSMVAGRKKAKARRERQAKLKSTPRSRPSKIDDTLELTKLAASLLELCGGSREAVNHLLDIAELVTEAD